MVHGPCCMVHLVLKDLAGFQMYIILCAAKASLLGPVSYLLSNEASIPEC